MVRSGNEEVKILNGGQRGPGDGGCSGNRGRSYLVERSMWPKGVLVRAAEILIKDGESTVSLGLRKAPVRGR